MRSKYLLPSLLSLVLLSGVSSPSLSAQQIPEAKQEKTAKIPHNFAKWEPEIAAFEAEIKRDFASPTLFAEKIRDAMERFGLLSRIESGESLRAARDTEAWKKLQEVLEALQMIAVLGGEQVVSLRQFYSELVRALQDTSASATLTEERVRVA